MKFLRMLGFGSRIDARRLYFHRTKLLYDLECESDRVTVIQTFLLMTYWHETLDDEKDASHWIGIAVSLAETTCMSSVLGTATTSEQKLWKRIWWSCSTRYCLVGLGLRRPAKIESAKFNVPMLEEGDFDIRVLPDTAVLNSAQCTILGNIEMQSELAALFVAKAKLCLCIRRLLATQYSAKFRAGMTGCGTTKSAMMLSPMASSLISVNSIDKALKDWEESLPRCCQNRTPSASEDGRSTIALHRALLHMLYHAAIVALHRPSCQPFLQAGIERQAYSHSRVSEAAMRISHLAAMLSSLCLDRFLPTSSVTAIMLAVISHISTAKQNLSREGRAQVNRDIMRCVYVLNALRGVHSVANIALDIIRTALTAKTP